MPDQSTEAETVRTLFDLYLRHGSIIVVKQHADRMGLRTKARGIPATRSSRVHKTDDARERGANGEDAADPRTQEAVARENIVESADRPAKRTRNGCGDLPFSRSHIHYILTSPVYAGRIRHRSRIYEGQHPAIMDPAVFDDVQERLKATAGRKRGRKGSDTGISLLAGKLYDETGDRLTPTHANKKGRRYRYYISNRMITSNGDTGKSKLEKGWRLPAKPLEQQLAAAVQGHFSIACQLTC